MMWLFLITFTSSYNRRHRRRTFLSWKLRTISPPSSQLKNFHYFKFICFSIYIFAQSPFKTTKHYIKIFK
ncbi:hypothetical protein BpHYR1_027936 [Brachionus plicatilis]|uniref:Uncharacterized protein n=1 Tax=Brachionus plicatilis TaxID=10195 RepID=A0A3M7PL20_BRAPC|nr:hypothetical protein BpHYR1_027936 [Brachionus plicatilis]